MGLTPAEVAEFVAKCDNIIAEIIKVNTQRTLLRSANNEKKILFDTEGVGVTVCLAALIFGL